MAHEKGWEWEWWGCLTTEDGRGDCRGYRSCEDCWSANCISKVYLFVEEKFEGVTECSLYRSVNSSIYLFIIHGIICIRHRLVHVSFCDQLIALYTCLYIVMYIWLVWIVLSHVHNTMLPIDYCNQHIFLINIKIKHNYLHLCHELIHELNTHQRWCI